MGELSNYFTTGIGIEREVMMVSQFYHKEGEK